VTLPRITRHQAFALDPLYWGGVREEGEIGGERQGDVGGEREGLRQLFIDLNKKHKYCVKTISRSLWYFCGSLRVAASAGNPRSHPILNMDGPWRTSDPPLAHVSAVCGATAYVPKLFITLTRKAHTTMTKCAKPRRHLVRLSATQT